ncbi:MAG TPA: phosphoribosyltransferase family protein [Nitrososphaeraceae archaeon]
MSTISEEDNSNYSIDNHALFVDRTHAAKLLAEKLKGSINKIFEDGVDSQERRQQLLTLAIPRGGVITRDIISSALNVKLDIIVSKKIGAPYNPELAIGAIMHDGTFFPNVDIIQLLGISKEYINHQISIQKKEIERRLILFRGANTSNRYEIDGKTIILVDDGIATGATVFACINWLKRQNPRDLILAVPVAPRDTIEKLQQQIDTVVVLYAPRLFASVGAFYQDFLQVSDEKVIEIMTKYRDK